MSYDLYFVKGKDLNSDNVYDILEISDLKSDNEIFLSKDFMKSLIEELKSEGLVFEVFVGKDEDYFELNFPSYQVSMFNSQIAISLPYWDENSNAGINKDVKQITNVLLANGLRGFDPQSEEFITEAYEIHETFTETKAEVDSLVNTEIQSHEANTLLYVGIGLGLMLITFLIWKMIR
ncbi:hypothetical protein [Croceimicrobium hydrocarbonivorans]|uniref:Uncharacterized protein n=1 Tax=Croceimicrobium hydrocarbonivorans TaxID=2761580 RepID=A0A7H0VD57_9FLAO|nr:hypothetical protein [Croceimicrobium hydrocarbonivorans]QNR23655.1 hypothetical protein H4K34_14925 [Croceimicrobium hydrocarbonivorans]